RARRGQHLGSAPGRRHRERPTDALRGTRDEHPRAADVTPLTHDWHSADRSEVRTRRQEYSATLPPFPGTRFPVKAENLHPTEQPRTPLPDVRGMAGAPIVAYTAPTGFRS